LKETSFTHLVRPVKVQGCSDARVAKINQEIGVWEAYVRDRSASSQAKMQRALLQGVATADLTQVIQSAPNAGRNRSPIDLFAELQHGRTRACNISTTRGGASDGIARATG